jgi:hypothetical protein
MAIMATDSWTKEWTIVKSLNDFSHVITPKQTLTFAPAVREGVPGYTISHNGSDCNKGRFKGTFLQLQDGTVPDLATIAGDDVSQLQQDLSNDAVLKDIADYVNANGDTLLRLAGAVELPQHARSPGGEPLQFYVYQINKAVENDRTMVFFQAKMNANDAANGGGTVAGYS